MAEETYPAGPDRGEGVHTACTPGNHPRRLDNHSRSKGEPWQGASNRGGPS